MRRLRSTLRLAAVIGSLVMSGLFSGCDLPDRHDIGIFRKPAVWEVADPEAASRDRIEPSGLSRNSSNKQSSDDTWHSWYLHLIDRAGVVGGVEMQSERVTSTAAEDQIRVTRRERVLVQSDVAESAAANSRSSWTPNTFRYLTANDQTFWYTLDGEMMRAETRVRFGPLEQSLTVEVEETQIRFNPNESSGAQSKVIAHQGELAGPLAVYRSLMGNPLTTRQQREVTVMLPLQGSTARLQMVGQPSVLARRMTKDGLTMDTLHEAVAVLSIDPARQQQQYYWYDDEGVVQSTNVRGDPRFTYRCDESQYAEMEKRFQSQQYPIEVDVPGRKIGPGKLTLLGLDIEQSPYSLASRTSTWSGISSAPHQYVQQIDASHQRIVLTASSFSLAKYEELSPRYESAVENADLAETAVLNYQSAEVQRVLQVAASTTGMTEQESAVELNRTVHSLLAFTPLSAGIRSAGSVAQASLADSTEHAILLTAILRSKNIPARLAIGLRYLPGQSAASAFSESAATAPHSPAHRFVFHAWVIAHVEEGWISLDPTTGAPTGPDCLTLDIANFSNLDASELINRYLAILRSLRIAVSAVVIER